MNELEAFEYITTFSIDHRGVLYIKDMEKYNQACDIVEEALKKLQNKK